MANPLRLVPGGMEGNGVGQSTAGLSSLCFSEHWGGVEGTQHEIGGMGWAGLAVGIARQLLLRGRALAASCAGQVNPLPPHHLPFAPWFWGRIFLSTSLGPSSTPASS